MDHAELLERAAFGKNVEAFWDSQIGTYLRNRAREVYTAAHDQLKHCDPTDWRTVAKCQSDIFKAEEFERWLSEAILDGIKSLDLIEGDDFNAE